MDSSLLLAYLLKEAQNNRVSLAKVALIKLLYLLEVEYFRYQRERVTGLKWLFYHYGPYPPSVEKALKENFTSDKKETAQGREFISLKPKRALAQRLNSEPIPAVITSLTQSIIDRWAGVKLNILLNYVYFETEPMQNVKRGDELNFNKIKPIEDIKIEMSLEKRQQLEQIRSKLNKMCIKINRMPFQVIKDEVYLKNIVFWDRDTANISGEAVIDESLTENERL